MVVNKALFAVDGSEVAKKAIELVEILGAANKGVQVILLHVLEPIPMLIGNPMRDKIHAEMRAEGEKILTPFKAALDKMGVSNVTRIAQGDAGDQVLEIAKEEKCEIIVMGAHGKTSVGEIILGSVSQHVLHFSRIPVMIAR